MDSPKRAGGDLIRQPFLATAAKGRAISTSRKGKIFFAQGDVGQQVDPAINVRTQRKRHCRHDYRRDRNGYCVSIRIPSRNRPAPRCYAGIVGPATGSTLVPVVFALVADPIGGSFVASVACPGGNVTGFIRIEPPLAARRSRRSPSPRRRARWLRLFSILCASWAPNLFLDALLCFDPRTPHTLMGEQ
jgi:hypothetical protein